MRDICHHADIELAGIHTVLRPAVRSGLEHDMRYTGSRHPGQIMLHFGGIRRGDVKAGIQHFVSDHGIDG